MTTPLARRSLALITVAALMASAVALAANAAIRPAPAGAAEQSRYIVLLSEPPLSRYDGGVAGLAATDPSVTGAIRLDTTSASSQAYLAYLRTSQDATVATINAVAGRSVEVVFRYDTVLNGFTLLLSPAEAAAVAGVAGVARVQPDEDRELLTDEGPDWIGAPTVWGSGGAGTRGEGLVAGVIDTGINPDHPSFADIGGDGYNHSNPRGQFYGVCAAAATLLCNDKLIGMYDFTGTGPEDDNGHGSHTASTVAGNVHSARLIGPTITIERPISGVAPHANVIAYKACVTTPAAGTCPLSALLAAINQATLDMVDVINFSIGGGSGDPWFDPDSQAFLNATNAGVFASVSAGNDGPGPETVGSPADSPWVMSVAAATHNRTFLNSVVDMTGGSSTPPADILGKGLTSGPVSAPIVYAGDHGAALCGAGPANPGTGEGTHNPFTAGQFAGKIVVCDRGTYGRVHKAENVAEAGAVGYILANDEPNGDSLVADPYPIPGVHISYADGLVLKAWLDSGSSHAGTITGMVTDENMQGDVTASFSSRGPNNAAVGAPADVIKPDITAPGVDILAAFHTPAGSTSTAPEYGVISGTSMSSPHAAGAAVLIRALHPEWSPHEVRSALMTTSVTDGITKEDATTPADPFDRGAGRVDLTVAGAAGLVLDETTEDFTAADPVADGDPSTLNLPSLGEDACEETCSWVRTVTSTAAGSVTWTASVSGLDLSVEPSTFTVGPGEDASFRVVANVGDLPLDRWSFGQVTLTSSDPSLPGVHLPVAVRHVSSLPFAAPDLADPGDSATGDYTLTWGDVADEVGYRVQEATTFVELFSDDAESGLAGTWKTEDAPNGWTASSLQASSGTQSYTTLYTDEKTSLLTLAQPLSVPAGTEATVIFTSWEDLEPGFDYGYVDGSNDGGETWKQLLRVNGNSGGWVTRYASLGDLTGDVLVRFRFESDQLISFPVHQGWFVDDIQVVAGAWTSIGETGAGETSLAVSDQADGTYFHRVAGLYDLGGSAPYVGPWSNVVDVAVDAPDPQPDLQVTNMTASSGKAREGSRVTVTATVTNASPDVAAGTFATQFVLDDGTVLGAPTASLGPGQSADVSVTWDTRGVKGERTITAIADSAGAVVESDEGNNAGVLAVTIQGNKVKNGSFEQANSAGTGPDGWSGSSTGAGTTSWSQSGSDGERSASISGTGASAALAGVPSWNSDPVRVTPGETLTLVASVRTDGVSSAPSVGLAYLGPAGNVVQTVAVLTAPLRTDGFELLEQTVTIPAGVVQVRVVLTGFAPTDVATRGTVTFDDVGLFAE